MSSVFRLLVEFVHRRVAENFWRNRPDLRATRRGGSRRISPSCRSYCGVEVVAKGRGERAAWVEYSRPLTTSSHLSLALKPFATLNARKAVRDLAPQRPSTGPFRNCSSISRFCAAAISLGGGFNLLAPCKGATRALRSARGPSVTALFPRKKK